MAEEAPIRWTVLQMTTTGSEQKPKQNYLRALESESRQADTGGESSLRGKLLD